MAFLKIENVAIRGISACVPSHIEENIDLEVFKQGEAERVIAQTKIIRKHTVSPGTTASDLCAKATEVLLKELSWEKETIDALVFVSSAADYIVPPTACILQDKLQLPESCLCMEIKHGCPGWVVGMTSASSLINGKALKRVLLLCGDTSTLLNSPLDKETRPIFGDAGTCTALEYDANAPEMYFEHGTRGKDFKSIFTPSGGCRNGVKEEDLQFIEYGVNQKRRNIDCSMDGMNVFAFGMSTAPKSVASLADFYNLNLNDVDYFVMHQANHYLNERIRKKLNFPPEKTPYSMFEYGNTSCASIPLTIVTQCNTDYATKHLKSIGCAFGVGLSWGSIYFETDSIICPSIIHY